MNQPKARFSARLAASLCLAWGAALPVRAALVNGANTIPGELPQVVMLLLSDGQECSGTIIGANTVLTAAHCLAHEDITNPQLKIDVPGEDSYYSVAGAAIPPEFNQSLQNTYGAEFVWRFGYITGDPRRDQLNDARLIQLAGLVIALQKHDIALLKLAPGVQFQTRPMPVLIHGPPQDFLNLDVVLAGYGGTSLTADNAGGIERKGTNRILVSSQGLFFTAGLSESQEHADGANASLAPGDSGGPMIARVGNNDYIIGEHVLIIPSLRILAAALGNVPGVSQLNQEMKSAHPLQSTSGDASLSDPDNVRFLQGAASEGYSIAWADVPQSGQIPRAAPAGNISPNFDPSFDSPRR